MRSLERSVSLEPSVSAGTENLSELCQSLLAALQKLFSPEPGRGFVWTLTQQLACSPDETSVRMQNAVTDMISAISTLRISSSNQPGVASGQVGMSTASSSSGVTSTVLPTVLSGTHGRQRRNERGIHKRELAEAGAFFVRQLPVVSCEIRFLFTRRIFAAALLRSGGDGDRAKDPPLPWKKN